jgi:hypothetical protein
MSIVRLRYYVECVILVQFVLRPNVKRSRRRLRFDLNPVAKTDGRIGKY